MDTPNIVPGANETFSSEPRPNYSANELDSWGFAKHLRDEQDDFGENVIPNVAMFSSMMNVIAKTYSYRYDEALKALPANALSMLRDTYITSLLQERAMPTVNRSWQLVGEDSNDPDQKLVCGQLSAIVKRTPYFKQQLEYLVKGGMWYGRYGSQIQYEQQSYHNHVRAWTVKKHSPVNGDKIMGAWDDTPAIFINTMLMSNYPSEYIKLTDRVPALLLAKQHWRNQFIIHRHEVDDADYFEPEMAGRSQGTGIRNKIYWGWWLRDEALSWVIDFMKKVGALGLLVFSYELGNKASKIQAEQMALNSNKQTALIIGRPSGKDAGMLDPVHIPVNMQGVQYLQGLVQNYFEHHMERLIVGQTLSANTEGNGLGGSGVAAMHTTTKNNLLQYDADNLAETLNRDSIPVLMKLNYPSAKFRVRFEFTFEDPNASQKLTAIVQAAKLVPVRVMDIYQTLGIIKPEPTDEQVGGPPKAEGWAADNPGAQPVNGAPDQGEIQAQNVANQAIADKGVANDAEAAETAAADEDIFDWKPTKGGKGESATIDGDYRWRPTKNQRSDWFVTYDRGSDPGDWQATKSGRGEYSPSTHRWREIGTQHQEPNAAPGQALNNVKQHAEDRKNALANAMKSGRAIFDNPAMGPGAKQRFIQKAAEHAPALFELMQGKKLPPNMLHQVEEEVSRLVSVNPKYQNLVDDFKASMWAAAHKQELHAESTYRSQQPPQGDLPQMEAPPRSPQGTPIAPGFANSGAPTPAPTSTSLTMKGPAPDAQKNEEETLEPALKREDEHAAAEKAAEKPAELPMPEKPKLSPEELARAQKGVEAREKREAATAKTTPLPAAPVAAKPDDIAALKNKYPNLSEDEIKETVGEAKQIGSPKEAFDRQAAKPEEPPVAKQPASEAQPKVEAKPPEPRAEAAPQEAGSGEKAQVKPATPTPAVKPPAPPVDPLPPLEAPPPAQQAPGVYKPTIDFNTFKAQNPSKTGQDLYDAYDAAIKEQESGAKNPQQTTPTLDHEELSDALGKYAPKLERLAEKHSLHLPDLHAEAQKLIDAGESPKKAYAKVHAQAVLKGAMTAKPKAPTLPEASASEPNAEPSAEPAANSALQKLMDHSAAVHGHAAMLAEHHNQSIKPHNRIHDMFDAALGNERDLRAKNKGAYGSKAPSIPRDKNEIQRIIQEGDAATIQKRFGISADMLQAAADEDPETRDYLRSKMGMSADAEASHGEGHTKATDAIHGILSHGRIKGMTMDQALEMAREHHEGLEHEAKKNPPVKTDDDDTIPFQRDESYA
jgi:Protein of unknown function (DUF935)